MSRTTDARDGAQKWLRRSIVAAVLVGAASSPLWWNAGSFAQQRTDQRQQGQQPQQQQQPPSEQQLAELMKKYEEAATPGQFHEHLKPLAGDWEVTAEFQSPAGSMTSHGKASCEWMLDGRFLKQDFSGSMMDREFSGMGFTGYDNSTRKYQSTWMDSMSTAIFYMEGDIDEEGKILTLTGQGVDPATGEMKTYKHVWRMESSDQNVMEMYEPGPEGQMTRTATLTYKRVR